MGIVITAGDDANIQLRLKIGTSNHNLTAATFETKVRKNDDTEITLNNAAHTLSDQSDSDNHGLVTVNIPAATSVNLKTGAGLNIMTKVTQGGNVTYFHGKGVLTVRSAST